MMNDSRQWRFQWHFQEDDAWSNPFVETWHHIYQSGSNHLFFCPQLVRIWYEVYHCIRKIQPAFLLADNGEKRLVWPLIIDKSPLKRGGFKSLRPAGFYEFDCHDPITDGMMSLEDWIGFYCQFIEEFSTVLQGRSGYLWIPRLYNIPAIRCEPYPWMRPGTTSPFIDLTRYDSLDNLLLTCSKQHRQDVRRQTRRLSEKGDVQLVSYTARDLDQAFEELKIHLEHHSIQWPGVPHAAGWHERLIKELLPTGMVDFTVLRCGDEVISRHLGFSDSDSYYYYMPTYNSKWYNFSPGKIHLARLVERAINQDKKRFELLSGNESYKYQWTRDEIQLHGLKYDRFPMRTALLEWCRSFVAHR